MKWFLKVFRQYTDFDGLARRKEFWMFYLIHMLIIFFFVFLAALTENSNTMQTGVVLIAVCYMLGILLPTIAVQVRRLHDISKSGWWLLIAFIPIIGGIILFIFLVTNGDEGENYYGPDPKEDHSPDELDDIGKYNYQ